MTNLLEKALITGFGISILILFLSLLLPFFEQLNQYNNDQRNEVETYIGFINEMDSAISWVNDNLDEKIFIKIDYPEKLNLTLKDKYAKFYYIIDNVIHSIIYEYEQDFIERDYQDMAPSSYYLGISYNLNFINVTLSIA